MLSTEQGERLRPAFRGAGRVGCGRRGEGGGEQQHAPTGGGPGLFLQSRQSFLGDLSRVALQAGRHEHVDPGGGDVRLDHAEGLRHLLGFVEQGQGAGQVAASEGDYRPVLAQRRPFELLPGLGEQSVGAGVVAVAAVEGAEADTGDGSMSHGAGPATGQCRPAAARPRFWAASSIAA